MTWSEYKRMMTEHIKKTEEKTKKESVKNVERKRAGAKQPDQVTQVREIIIISSIKITFLNNTMITI